MIKVVLKKESNEIDLRYINEFTPIFAKRNGKLRGMLIKEDDGWILRTGGENGSSGHYSTIKRCIDIDMGLGYEFFIED